MLKLLRKICPTGGGANSSKAKNGRASSIGRFIGSRLSTKGAILIEFAFSVPIFLTLIYYLHDIPKAQRYHRQMQFVAQEVVQMLQNISKSRTDKAIKLRDCVYILHSACLASFPGRSGVPYQSEYLQFGFFPEMLLYYVVGEPNGKASVKWLVDAYIASPISSWQWNIGILYRDYPASQIRYKVNVAPSEIYKGLQIKEGEAKCIVECVLRYHPNMKFADGRPCRNASFRDLFGFLLYTPKHDTVYQETYNFFGGVVVFTPNDGLFSEIPPK